MPDSTSVMEQTVWRKIDYLPWWVWKPWVSTPSSLVDGHDLSIVDEDEKTEPRLGLDAFIVIIDGRMTTGLAIGCGGVVASHHAGTIAQGSS
jgi:hypothetical protein